MEKILQSPHALRLFFLVTAAIGWATAQYEKGLLRVASASTLALLDAILAVIALLVYIGVRGGWGGFTQLFSQLRELATQDTSVLGVLSVYGAAAGLLGTILLKHHAVTDYRLTDLFVSLAVGAAGIHVLSESGLTLGRGVGLLLMAAGGYLTLRD
jgi:hypothetical protein